MTDAPKYVVTDSSDLPEVVHHSSPEVVQENYPECIDSTLPEAVPTPALDNKEIASPPKEPTICGLRRKTFWIVFVVVLAIIVAAAVGGGVGGALANKKSDDSTSTSGSSSSSSDSSSSSGDASSTSSATTLLPNTRLSSINFTDSDGTENYHVFYQLTSKAIYQSAWNSSARTWEAFEVLSDTDNIKNNTPISAALYWHSSSRRDFHIQYLDPSNGIRGLISNNKPYGPFDSSGINGRYTAGPSSGLASYGRACQDCYNANVVVWQDAKAKLQVAVNSPWTQQQLPPSTPSAVNGTRMALGPAFAAGGTKYLTWYVNGEDTGNLTQLLWDGKNWFNSTLPAQLGADAAIAAFAYGYNGTADFSMQAVTSKQNGDGVGLTAWDAAEETWAEGVDGSSGATGLEIIAAGSDLAANYGGRVYGFVGNGSLGEWLWSQEGGYTFNGWVNTTIP
ncbi:hypothetical protein MPH_09986 [Macrophomina phaseolina MS6]|uniref:Fucose-specific lectin n=1 Tax=Macrophomina phaseolina (strain MS6) TaxID=1126212 RepID=K2RJ31_MACPH|nr:hypothetical protein MPH_09986 [Macrophomina phaseolina MS6]